VPTSLHRGICRGVGPIKMRQRRDTLASTYFSMVINVPTLPIITKCDFTHTTPKSRLRSCNIAINRPERLPFAL
jgi:hypothetical protein